jgi:hypothetical protein
MSRILERGDLVPHFDVRTTDGDIVGYAAIWQRRHLVLVTLPAHESPDDATYAAELAARTAEFAEHEATCIATRDPVAGLPAPGALVADRWGEIVNIAHGSDVRALPTLADLLEWVDYVARRCPECEGESR